VIYAAPGSSFEAVVNGYATGLATVRARILDNAGATVYGPSTTGVAELVAGSGSYVVTLTAPSTAGQYSVGWDTGSVSPTTWTTEDLVVTATTPGGGLPSGYDLCTVADVKSSLELTTTDNDTLIQSLITAASYAIPQRYQREFIGPTGGTRSFAVGRYGRLVDLAPYDLRSGGTLTLHPEESATALTLDQDYVLLPDGGHPLGGTYLKARLSSRLVFNSTLYREFGQARLRVTGNWGTAAPSSAVDETIKRGAVLTVSSWMDRAVAEFALGEGGDGRALRPDRFGTYAIPSAAHSLLMPWGRIGTA
jgi:hypothetical protein